MVSLSSNNIAVLKIKGKQYKVAEGDEILVDKFVAKEVPFETLLVAKDDKVEVGNPFLKKVDIKLEILKEEELGEKISVFKYKAKSRYRKKTGFRPKFTRVLVKKIG